ncbi:hypothetical protein PS3A_39970 [Pseudomonas sp. 3A(2025)]
MNTPPTDFQETLQAAALHFLQRHRDEHLTHDYYLLDRATVYLTISFDVPYHRAAKIVDLAVQDITGAPNSTR